MKRENRMIVLLNTAQANTIGRRLQKIVTTLVPRQQLEICRSSEELSQRLRRPLCKEFIGVFLTSNRQELSDLLSIRNLLTDIRIILIVPDSEKDTVSKGHTLYPRFLSFVDSDFKDVAAVLGKMLEIKNSNNTLIDRR